jgi:hypothetical protein
MTRPGAAGGFASACLLFAALLAGAAAGLPHFGPALFGGPFALLVAVLAIGTCSGLFALLATVLGAYSFRSPWGKVGAVGGPILLAGDVAYLLWALSLC